MMRHYHSKRISSVPKITKGGFLGKSKDDSVDDTTREEKYFSQ